MVVRCFQAQQLSRAEKINLDLNSVFLSVGRLKKNEITEDELKTIETSACPGCGSCAGMFTANTMNCLCEALGIALPGNGTIPAVSSRRYSLATKAGYQIVQLLKENICVRDIITRDAIYNAFVVDMALGGSTNSVLHLLALAAEAGIEFSLKDVDVVSKKNP